MGSLFAKIMHMASGPVRPIRSWSIVRFLLLALFWGVVTPIVGFWCLFYDNNGAYKSFEDIVRWIGGNLKSPMSILRPLALLGGIVLGGGHYLLLRALPFESRVAFRSVEKWITLLALALLAIVPACQIMWWFHARGLYTRNCLSGDGIWSDLKAMEVGGDYEAMVARTESSCIAFQAARSELGDWFIPRQPSGGGTSYLFVTLVGLHGEPFQFNSPDSLTSYLCTYEAGPHGPTAPKSCEPLAKAMVKSEVPIIHMTLWWLNQRHTLAMEARELSDRGDPSFASWKDAMTSSLPMFARLLHLVTAFVRPVHRWPLLKFLCLMLFWTGFALTCALCYVADGIRTAGIPLSNLVDELGEELKSSYSLVGPLCLFGVALLGGSHYLILRMLPFEGRKPFRSGERWLSLVAIVLMVSASTFHLKRALRTRELLEICWGCRTGPLDWEAKVAIGRYTEVVREMEEASRAFRVARLELADRFVPADQYGGAGWSYMLITLAAYHPEPFALNAPISMVRFLCGLVDDGRGDCMKPPKSCAPLALEMIKSEEPIVRIAGLWWLGEKEAFDREVEERLRAGDTSFQDWKGLGAR